MYMLGQPPAEISHLPWRERERLLDVVRKRVFAQQGFERLHVLAYMLVALGLLLANLLLSWDASGHAVLGMVTSAFMVLGLSKQICLALDLRKQTRKVLREVMREQGIRPCCCFECGANLTATEGGTCPECHALIGIPSCPVCGQPNPSA
jgi:hypothetical protein